MKAVLLSIKPKYCELIASGRKTVELRKTRPKIDASFKVYMYCTKPKRTAYYSAVGLSTDELYRLPNGEIKYGCSIELAGYDNYTDDNFLNGKVIGEYVCDEIRFANAVDLWIAEDAETTLKGTCLTKEDVYKYLGVKSGTSRYDKKYEFYAWHISDLKIYDKPKYLGEFCKPCDPLPGCFCDYCKAHGRSPNMEIQRPPQSWCYVEDLEV